MLKEATISKQKIVNTFTELSEESSLEQINTTDIIKKVSLSRPTFYYYSNQDNLVETKYSAKVYDLSKRCSNRDATIS
jgi:ACT domain-containing protein